MQTGLRDVCCSSGLGSLFSPYQKQIQKELRERLSQQTIITLSTYTHLILLRTSFLTSFRYSLTQSLQAQLNACVLDFPHLPLTTFLFGQSALTVALTATSRRHRNDCFPLFFPEGYVTVLCFTALNMSEGKSFSSLSLEGAETLHEREEHHVRDSILTFQH